MHSKTLSVRIVVHLPRKGGPGQPFPSRSSCVHQSYRKPPPRKEQLAYADSKKLKKNLWCSSQGKVGLALLGPVSASRPDPAANLPVTFDPTL